MQSPHLDRRIASILSKKGAYMFVPILRKPNMVVFMWHIGDCFMLSLPPGVKPCLNPTYMGLAAFNLG